MNSPVSELMGISKISFSPVLVGQSLNVWSLRGFARLDELAVISKADVANDVDNETAPQRLPDNKHAEEAMDYALDADENNLSALRFFPEVILNCRDASVLNILDLAGDSIEFSSLLGTNEGVDLVTIEVELDKIDRDLKKPQISIVDGNHRLFKALERKSEMPDLEFPVVPFALLIGLSDKQEALLFMALNSKHKGMDTSHLTQLEFELNEMRALLRYTSGQANWLAHELKMTGEPFQGLVRSYANRKAYRDQGLPIPPLGLKSLTTAIQKTITKSDRIKSLWAPATATEEEMISKANVVKTGLSRYWSAVKTNFPDAWQDKNNFILLQSIGLTAFSALAAVVIDKAITEKRFDQNDFNLTLKHIADRVSLAKSDPLWEGVAGAAGAEKVYSVLFDAFNQDMDMTIVLEAWGTPQVSKLDS